MCVCGRRSRRPATTSFTGSTPFLSILFSFFTSLTAGNCREWIRSPISFVSARVASFSEDSTDRRSSGDWFASPASSASSGESIFRQVKLEPPLFRLFSCFISNYQLVARVVRLWDRFWWLLNFDTSGHHQWATTTAFYVVISLLKAYERFLACLLMKTTYIYHYWIVLGGIIGTTASCRRPPPPAGGHHHSDHHWPPCKVAVGLTLIPWVWLGNVLKS